MPGIITIHEAKRSLSLSPIRVYLCMGLRTAAVPVYRYERKYKDRLGNNNSTYMVLICSVKVV